MPSRAVSVNPTASELHGRDVACIASNAGAGTQMIAQRRWPTSQMVTSRTPCKTDTSSRAAEAFAFLRRARGVAIEQAIRGGRRFVAELDVDAHGKFIRQNALDDFHRAERANHEPAEISPTLGDRVAWSVLPIYRQYNEESDLLLFVLYECYPLRRDRVSAVAGEQQRFVAHGVGRQIKSESIFISARRRGVVDGRVLLASRGRRHAAVRVPLRDREAGASVLSGGGLPGGAIRVKNAGAPTPTRGCR